MHNPLSALVLVLLLLSAGCITTAEEWNQRGETHHTMGQYDEAVAAFDRAIALDPDSHHAWKNRGLSLALLGRDEESRASFSRAIALCPNCSDAYYYQALARNATGDHRGAMESLDHAIAIAPQNQDQVFTLFQSLIMRGDLLTVENRLEEANLSYRIANEVMMGTI